MTPMMSRRPRPHAIRWLLLLSAIALLAGVARLAWSQAAPVGSPTTADDSAAQDAREARGLAAIRALLEGEVDALLATFAPALRDRVPRATLAAAGPALRTQVGTAREFGAARHGCAGDRRILRQHVAFERAELDLQVAFDGAGDVVGVTAVAPDEVTPCSGEASASARAVAAPSLPDGVTETEIVLGAEDWPLPGVFTRPASAAPVAAVVLVHGSGPHDADQTVFSQPVFRQIAHGLARHGIASLRYVKRTRAHGPRMARETPDFGIAEETVDDAVRGARWLLAREDVGAVFVIGHSQGGMMAPAIAAQAPAVSGLVILAGPARPLEDLIVEQFNFLAPTQGITAAQLAEAELQRQRVKTLAAGGTPDGSLPLGLSAAWWRSLSQYDPVAQAATLPQPMFIARGERDYQVTAADQQRWQEGLAGQERITFRSWPRLNHLLVAGDAPSLPAEYFTAGNAVADEAIDDIADWIHQHAGAQPAVARED